MPPDTPTAFTATAHALHGDPGVDAGLDRRPARSATSSMPAPPPACTILGSSTLQRPDHDQRGRCAVGHLLPAAARAERGRHQRPDAAERQVTVGACAVPAAPGRFAASPTTAFVNLQWTAPASGGRRATGSPWARRPAWPTWACRTTPRASRAWRVRRRYGSYFVQRARHQRVRPQPAVERGDPARAAVHGRAVGADAAWRSPGTARSSPSRGPRRPASAPTAIHSCRRQCPGRQQPPGVSHRQCQHQPGGPGAGQAPTTCA